MKDKAEWKPEGSNRLKRKLMVKTWKKYYGVKTEVKNLKRKLMVKS